MKNILFITAFIITSISVWSQEKVDDRDLLELKARMEGTFTSELQAKSDSDYYNIHLHMSAIWERSEDGYWLYVEQAIASALNKPYRQRIYHLYRQDDITLVSKVYEMNAPMRFAGAYANPELLTGLTKDSLIDRQGCAIYLRKDKSGNFSGSTPGKECLSSLRGAAYATSEVVIHEDKLVSWDRGWDKDDKQVWGAEKGGYQFIKKNE
ncbi:MAG TPA: chromophore lyase CpcT/CpeT [Ferruginibacter sp.]|nr:chromophore lyase CpcT/CpeT [Ferruginibacter sp.]HPH89619.1 chromophore lyase CpcT/CpeT [Ferruginibacter sp.]